MYIGIRQKKKNIRFVLVCVLVALVGFIGFFLNRDLSEDFIKASEPKNIILSNVWESSVTVTWITEAKTDGYLVLYKNSEKIGDFKDVRGTGKYHTHYIDVVGLEPSTSYEFEIFSAGVQRLDEDGQKVIFNTSEILPEIPAPNIVNGSFSSGDVVVFLLLDDLSVNYPISTYVTDQGLWSLDLSKFLPINFEGDFVFRQDESIKVLFYGNDGGKVFRGNKNVLFDEEDNFLDSSFLLQSFEDVFLHIPDIAKFKNEVTREDVQEKQEGAVEEVEQEEVEEVLGVDVEKEKVEEVSDNEVKWESLDTTY